jgi:hypothetical protein
MQDSGAVSPADFGAAYSARLAEGGDGVKIEYKVIAETAGYVAIEFTKCEGIEREKTHVAVNGIEISSVKSPDYTLTKVLFIHGNDIDDDSCPVVIQKSHWPEVKAALDSLKAPKKSVLRRLCAIPGHVGIRVVDTKQKDFVVSNGSLTEGVCVTATRRPGYDNGILYLHGTETEKNFIPFFLHE